MSRTAAITALGRYVPEDKLTNKDLEQIVDTSDEWIFTRTGIKERRILKDPNKPTSYLAVKAAEDLIRRSNLNPLDIDLVLVATATPDMSVASTAVYVATQIGAEKAFGYDLQAACSSFLYAMSTAAAYIESGRYKKILVIGADKMSSIVDYTDRTTCIIFGDGAGAVLFEPNEEGLGWQDEYLRGDAVGRQFLKIEAGGSLLPTSQQTLDNGKHFIKQEGKKVFKYAISNMCSASKEIIKKNQLSSDEIDWLVAHQANKRIVEATAEKIGLPLEKVMMNIQHYGNTTSATIPLLLADYEILLKKGNNIIFATFGGGFAWGAAYLKWAYDNK